MNNSSIGHIFTPIVILTCQSLGCNPVGPLLLLYAARQSAFWTPAATGTIALAVGLGGYDQKDLIKMSWIPSLIIGVIGVFWIMTIFPAFPG
jgi:di/tricarboxylate transporter